MLALGSGCKYRFSSAERFDCTETIINPLFADSYQNTISEWRVTIKLHLTEQTGHKQYTSGVTVSHHPLMGSSSCRKTSSGLPLILHYGELYNYFIIYYNVIIIEIKCKINVMCLNHSETISPTAGLWKNCLPQNQSLMPKRLGTFAIMNYKFSKSNVILLIFFSLQFLYFI